MELEKKSPKSFVLPLLFCSLTMVLFGRYRLFLQDYENRLIQTQKEIFKDPPVSQLSSVFVF